MSDNWPKVKLGDVLRRSEETVNLRPDVEYREITVKLWGKGVVLRGIATGAEIAASRRMVARSGQFILSRIDARNGALGIVPHDLDGAVLSNDFPVFNVIHDRMFPSYLGWMCKTSEFVEQCRLASEGTTNRVRLQEEKFLAREVPLPTLEVQRRIVARIEELTAKIEEARELRRQTVEETPSILRATLFRLSQTLSPNGTLKDVLAALPRNGWSARCDNAEHGTSVLSLAAVTGFRYRATEVKRTSLYAHREGHFWLRPGDLLITRSNTPELVGHAAIYDGRPTPCIYPDLMMRLELKKSACDPRFVWYWLQSPSARDFISKNAKGTSPTMKKISQGTVMAIPFPSSLSLSQQCGIVEHLDDLEKKTDELKAMQAKTSAELDALMPSILDKAFRGVSSSLPSR